MNPLFLPAAAKVRRGLVLAVLIGITAALPTATRVAGSYGTDLCGHLANVAYLASRLPSWPDCTELNACGMTFTKAWGTLSYLLLALLSRTVGLLDAYRIWQTGCFVVMSVGTYLFVIRLVKGRWAALAASGAYSFSYPISFYNGVWAMFPHLLAHALIPWVLLAGLDAWRQLGRPSSLRQMLLRALPCAVILAVTILIHPPVGARIGISLAVLLGSLELATPGLRVARCALLVGFLGCVATEGVLLSLANTLPALRLLSLLEAPQYWDFSALSPAIYVCRRLSFLTPASWSVPIELPYLGLGALASGALAVGGWIRIGRERASSELLAMLALGAAWILVGVVPWLYFAIPGLGNDGGNFRIWYFSAFGAALLAAGGVVVSSHLGARWRTLLRLIVVINCLDLLHLRVFLLKDLVPIDRSPEWTMWTAMKSHCERGSGRSIEWQNGTIKGIFGWVLSGLPDASLALLGEQSNHAFKEFSSWTRAALRGPNPAAALPALRLMDVSLVVADRKVGDSEADQAAERLARTPGFRLVETRLVPVQHHRAKPFRYNLLSVSDRLDCFLPRSTIAVHGPMGDAQRALNEALEKVAYDPTRCGVILLGGSRASASGGLLPCAIHTEIDGIRGALERALRTERASEVRPLRVITTRRTAERWEVDLHHRTGTPPLVFFSRQWLPDLRARNGEGSALDVYVAAGGLVAVAAPAKTTRIELFYHEPTLDRICKWIGGSAWAVASWALLVPLL